MTECIRLPMACACQAERRATLDALIDGRTATHLLHELYWEYSYRVTHIDVDMWMGITIEHYDDDKPRYYIECDRLEDGLARLIERLVSVGDGVNQGEGADEGTGGDQRLLQGDGPVVEGSDEGGDGR